VERNAILKAVLSRPELSLYALNAAMECAQGATPLVLACRLGRPDLVNILLDCPSILVDTRDAAGITPLMRMYTTLDFCCYAYLNNRSYLVSAFGRCRT
jgi:hypothetical protein